MSKEKDNNELKLLGLGMMLGLACFMLIGAVTDIMRFGQSRHQTLKDINDKLNPTTAVNATSPIQKKSVGYRFDCVDGVEYIIWEESMGAAPHVDKNNPYGKPFECE